jgi:D-hexose-6-phosphate mutarotase
LKLIKQLSLAFAIPNVIVFDYYRNKLPWIYITNEFATAEISLYGGQVMAFQPKGEKPVLWRSKHSHFHLGQPIRGGIPVCWPWFGGAQQPAHGFARTQMWKVIKTRNDKTGTTVILELWDNEETQKMMSTSFSLQLEVFVGKELKLTLKTYNRGTSDIVLTEALHTYFSIGDVASLAIDGVDDCSYLDATDGLKKLKQEGSVLFTQETDRMYAHNGSTEIKDSVLGRTIVVEKENSASTVIWNPWVDKSKAMPDFGNKEYIKMVCVETANVLDNKIIVAPSCEHTIQARISVKKG